MGLSDWVGRHELAGLARTHNAGRAHSRAGAASPPFEPLRGCSGLFARSRDRGSNDDTFDMGDNAMMKNRYRKETV